MYLYKLSKLGYKDIDGVRIAMTKNEAVRLIRALAEQLGERGVGKGGPIVEFREGLESENKLSFMAYSNEIYNGLVGTGVGRRRLVATSARTNRVSSTMYERIASKINTRYDVFMLTDKELAQLRRSVHTPSEILYGVVIEQSYRDLLVRPYKAGSPRGEYPPEIKKNISDYK